MASSRSRKHDDDEFDKPKSDAYTGILAVSLLFLIAGCVFLYLDASEYPDSTAPSPTRVNLSTSPPGGAGGGAGGIPPGGVGGIPPGGAGGIPPGGAGGVPPGGAGGVPPGGVGGGAPPG